MSLIEIKQEMEDDITREVEAIKEKIKKESIFDEAIEDLDYNGIDMDDINTIKVEKMDREEECKDKQTDSNNQCNVCKVIFDSLDELKTHRRLRNAKGRDVLNICCVCKKTFRLGDGGFRVHQRMHTGEKPYECDVCKKKFSSQSNMKKHEVFMHTDRRAFVCDICPKTFKQLAHLQDHKRSHSDSRPFQCDICYTDFKSKRTLTNHRRTHDKLSSDGRNNKTCLICSKKFTSFQLKMHMRNHEDSFACSDCNAVFGSFKQHAEHMEQVHSKSVHNECPECKELFTDRGELETHLRKKHTVSQRHECNVCLKVFNNYWNMKQHMKLHSESEVYKCEFCSKSIRNLYNYRRHLRIHTNYRPHVCDICNKGYTDGNYLKVHKIIHTGQKPYGCSICNKYYSILRLTKYHIRKHHADALGNCSLDDFVITDFNNIDVHKEMNIDVPFKTEPEDDPLGDITEEQSVKLDYPVNEVCIKQEPLACV